MIKNQSNVANLILYLVKSIHYFVLIKKDNQVQRDFEFYHEKFAIFKNFLIKMCNNQYYIKPIT